MIAIFLTWVLIFFLSINFGVLMNYILGIQKPKGFVTINFGLLLILVLGYIFAFFYRLNIEFISTLIVFGILIQIRLKNQIQVLWKQYKSNFQAFPFTLKIGFLCFLFLILAQSSKAPFLPDNESYYLQTIKWFNQYGFVKGMANLHPFYAQSSGWHIMQSIFSFSFFTDRFNDINGFIYLIFVFFSFDRLSNYYQNRDKIDLLFGLLPLFSLLLFQFINTPSPDLPIVLFTFYLLYTFLRDYNQFNRDTFYTTLCVFLFMMLIKVTPIVLVLIPIIIFFHQPNKKKPFLIGVLFSILAFVLFLGKNYVISGYPFFPSDLGAFLQPDWKMPQSIQEFYYDLTKASTLDIWIQEYKSLSALEYIKLWLTMPKVDGIFHWLITLIVLVIPGLLWVQKKATQHWVLYGVFVLHMILMFYSTAQFRFFMQFVLFYLVFIAVQVNWNQQLYLIGIYFVLIITSIPIFFPFQLDGFTNNNFKMNLKKFSLEELYLPHSNSQYFQEYQKTKKGNLEYYHPTESDFIWYSGNGNLPCTNQQLLEYLKEHFQVIPQQRTKNLKDGFFAKSTE